MAPRLVVIVGFEEVELLDVTGPASVFATASRLLGDPRGGYRVELAALRAGPFAAHGGLKLVADRALGRLRGPIDTLLVGGGDIDGKAVRDDQLARAIGRAARLARRVTSVCTGALLLAKAGLLDGRRATTHWAACAAMRARHPAVCVETDPIFVRDGNIWTSAGVTSGIDLCLALVEEDHGRPLALEVARFLVLYLRRTGGQSQFSAPLAVQCAEREPLRELQGWIGEHLADDLSIDALAERVGMSPRNFARVFRREVGVTPCAYVDALRVDAARGALERAREPIKRIARDAGFGTPETMSRVFRRLLGVSPLDVRRRFGVA